MAVFMATLDGSIVNVALPSIARAFGTGPAPTAWVATAYLLAIVISLLPLGRWSDRNGRTRGFLGGVWIFTAASLACALAPALEVLIAARAVQGLGAALLFANSTALLTIAFPARERGRTFGLNALMVGLGLATGPALGGWLLGLTGWPVVFLVKLPVGAACLMAAYRGLPGDRIARGRPPPVATLLRHPTFRTSATAGLLQALGVYITFVTVPFLLELGAGLRPAQVGLLLSSLSVAQLSIGPLSGTLSDRFGSRGLAAAGAGLTGAGTLGLAWLAAGPRAAEALIPLLVVGIGIGTFGPPNINAMMSSSPPAMLGLAGSFVALVRNLGFSLGALAAGGLLDWRAGALIAQGWGSPEAFRAAAAAVLLGAVALHAAAAAISLLGRRAQARPPVSGVDPAG
jgi:MFS family permease